MILLPKHGWNGNLMPPTQDDTIYYGQTTDDGCNNTNLLPSEKLMDCDSSKEPAEPVWQGREDDLGVRGNKIKTLKVDQERVDDLMDFGGRTGCSKKQSAISC